MSLELLVPPLELVVFGVVLLVELSGLLDDVVSELVVPELSLVVVLDVVLSVVLEVVGSVVEVVGSAAAFVSTSKARFSYTGGSLYRPFASLSVMSSPFSTILTIS